MPRLRNVQSGAVVSCSEETATRLGAQWQPADSPKVAEVKPPAVKKVAASKSERR